mmetsp:Transcript_21160/g.59558  ORF Transcript_21160/g.59558 Transcript_21160/m.59558 type:complete len:235 (+) Transcript_21160:88-792(+)
MADEGESPDHTFEHGQLSVIGQDLEEIPAKYGEMYGGKVTRLDMSWNRIRTLRNLDMFPNLEVLILDNNEITSEQSLPKLKKLHTLWMNKNDIDDVGLLFPKKTTTKLLPSLTYLSMLNNPGCPNELTQRDDDDYRRYRYFVLHRIPTLTMLDSAKVSAAERAEAQRVGHLMTVARPKKPRAPQTSEKKSDPDVNPLPQNVSEGGARGASFGVSRYVYYGTHSEGNRFILNTDL